MANLYVTEQNAIIRKTSDRLVLEKDDHILAEIPCLKLDAVLIFGNVQFTTQAAVEMLDHGIEMALFTRSGRLRGQLTPPKAKNVTLRMAQYEKSGSEEFCLGLARAIVRGKIQNSLSHLESFRKNHPEAVSPDALRALRERLEALPAAGDLNSLRGVEGSAAVSYFQALRHMVPTDFGFDGRNRRPPEDPVNALLSFGYVMLGNELQALLDGIGFDPYVGFYHRIDYARPSLALDLLEEFRASVVDRFTVKLLNLRRLGPDDFVGDRKRGIRLTREGLGIYFRALEAELETPRSMGEEELSFRQLFRRQAHRLSHAIEDDVPYEPFVLPC